MTRFEETARAIQRRLIDDQILRHTAVLYYQIPASAPHLQAAASAGIDEVTGSGGTAGQEVAIKSQGPVSQVHHSGKGSGSGIVSEGQPIEGLIESVEIQNPIRSPAQMDGGGSGNTIPGTEQSGMGDEEEIVIAAGAPITDDSIPVHQVHTSSDWAINHEGVGSSASPCKVPPAGSAAMNGDQPTEGRLASARLLQHARSGNSCNIEGNMDGAVDAHPTIDQKPGRGSGWQEDDRIGFPTTIHSATVIELDDRACNVEATRKSVRGCQDDAATSAGSVGDADPIITCEHHTNSSCPVPVFNQGFPNAGVHGQGITRSGTESLIVGDVRWRGWAISKPQGANGARTVQGDSARGRDIPGAEVSLRIGSIGLDTANPIRRNQPRTSSGDGPHAIRLRAKATRISQGHCCNPEESRRLEWETGGFHIISPGTT